MASKPYLVMWDSCVVIDYLKQHDARFPLIQPMIDQAEKGELKIVVSEITPAEVLTLEKIGGIDHATIAEHVSLINDFFERSYMVRRIVDKPVALLAAQLRRNYHPLGTCDAVILATAVLHKVPVVYTFDGDSAGNPKPGKMLPLDNKIAISPDGTTLRILKPAGRADGQISLDDMAADNDQASG